MYVLCYINLHISRVSLISKSETCPMHPNAHHTLLLREVLSDRDDPTSSTPDRKLYMKTIAMKYIIFTLSVLIGEFSFSQPLLTAKQIDRLADAGKIYGYLKYFHPTLQYKDHNLDSAFVVNVEGIINAKSRGEYASAIQRILSVMNDGLTGVANVKEEDPNYEPLPTEYYVKDSILYIYMNDAPFMSTNGRLAEALGKMEAAMGVIIDMRKPAYSRHYEVMQGRGKYFDWNTSWFKGENVIPSIRTVNYSGFPNEACKGCGNLGFKEEILSPIVGYANTELPVVFVVAQEHEIPLMALRLQRTGTTKILQQDGRELLPGSSVYFYIADSVLIQVRTGEAIDGDGSLLLVQPNATFTQQDGLEVVMAKARKLLLNGNAMDQERQRIHPLQVNRSFHFEGSSGYPTVGYRMLAVAKMFTVIENFYPSRSSMGKNWETAYKTAIPKFIGARDSLEYWRAIAELHANIQDNHGFVSKSQEWFSLRLNPIIQGRGALAPPVLTRMVQNKIVVTEVFNDSLCRAIGMQVGDIIVSIDDKDPIEMMDEARKYQNAGNRRSQNFYLASFLLFTDRGRIKKLKIQDKSGRVKEILMQAVNQFKGNWMQDAYVSRMFHRNRPLLKMLTKDIGYAGLTANKDSIFNMLERTKGFIFDLRGYPQGGDEFLSALMFNKKIKMTTPHIFQTLTGDLPSFSPKVVSVNQWGTTMPVDAYFTRYLTNDKELDLPVKVVVLVDETQQSAAETYTYTIKNMTKATSIGTPTGGAYAYFVNYTIPGNIRIWLSGSVISREGIQPDIFVEPTIHGIQSGRDEVLERAIEFLRTGK